MILPLVIVIERLLFNLLAARALTFTTVPKKVLNGFPNHFMLKAVDAYGTLVTITQIGIESVTVNLYTFILF